MDYNEFQKKDLDLLSQIDDLRTNSLDLQQQIIANEKEIIRLEHERTELRSEYTASESAESIFVYKGKEQRLREFKNEHGLRGNAIDNGEQ